MSRRAGLAVLLSCFVALAAAVVPWRVSSDALRSAVSARLHDIAGLELTAAGTATLAILPVPRLAFETVTLTSASGTPVARGGTLRGELRILPLLAGRLQFAELALTEATIDIELDDDLYNLPDKAVAALRARLDPAGARSHVARLVVNAAQLRLHHRRTGFETAVHDIHVAAEWPAPNGPLEATGSMTWRGEIIQIRGASIRPDALAAGRASPVRIDLSAPLAGFALAGELGVDRHLVGRSAFATRSLRDFSIWSGMPLPLSEFVGAFGLDGDVRVDRQGASWPAVRLTLGQDKLDGALSWRREGGRAIVTSTLAADRLDLTGVAAALARLRSASDGWSVEGFHPSGQSSTDFDLRLSAATARIGSVRLDDVAANLSVKPGRSEVSVNRATLNKGVAKGRALLVSGGDGLEIKAQSSFERLDAAGLLADLGLPRWASGSAQGQFALEGSGDTPAELVGSLHGRTQMTIRGGELVGIGLADLLRRRDARDDATPVVWQGGRTPFDQVSLQMTIVDGVATISDAKLSGSGVRAALQGRTSIVHRTVAAKASVEAAPASPGAPSPMVLDITGPLSKPTIVHGARSHSQSADAATPVAVQ
jgi:AsmA protein